MCVSLGHDDPQPPGGDRAVDEDRITGVLIQVKGNPLSFGLRIHRSGPFGNRRHFVDRFTEELFPVSGVSIVCGCAGSVDTASPGGNRKEKEKCEAATTAVVKCTSVQRRGIGPSLVCSLFPRCE